MTITKKTKLVRISKSNTKKRNKHDLNPKNIEYLKQVIRNKNKEVRGGTKEKRKSEMNKLLNNENEIEALLNRRQTKKNMSKSQDINNLVKSKNNKNPVKVEEINLDSDNFLGQIKSNTKNKENKLTKK